MIKKVIKIEEFYKKNYNYIENIKKYGAQNEAVVEVDGQIR